MSKKYVIFLIFTFCLINVYSQPVEDELLVDQGYIHNGQENQLSIFALASNPDKYDGKKVFITGYAKVHFGFYLYPDKSSCLDSFHENSLVITLTKKEHEERASKIKECEIIHISGQYEKTNTYGKDRFYSLKIGEIRLVDGIYEY